MSSKTKSKVETVPLDRFITGLRHQIKDAMDALQEELDDAKPKNSEESPVMPVFLLEELELSVGAQIDESVAAELRADGRVTGKGLIKVLLGGGEVSAGVAAGGKQERRGSESVRVRVLLKPKMASWDDDGWKLTDQIFLKSPQSDGA